MKFDKSLALQPEFRRLIPGGAHTYAKGDDQYPEFMPPYIVRGDGCRVWDADGNEFIEYGSGVRAIGLGHNYAPVVEAAAKQMRLGQNFIRPSTLEYEVAKELADLIPGAEMVKFGKNGSDATSSAIRLARAHTGRDLVAIADQPFFSADDWFIGTTGMPAGIPQAVRSLTLKFRYNDLPSLEALFREHPKQVACVILEGEKERPPENRFLHEAMALCHREGALFILDEMITGFRWHNAGAQAFHDIVPDLATWGKALGNGFSISALTGKREFMELGGWDHDRERAWVLSLTHGAESHSLAAASAVMKVYRDEPVVETLWTRGQTLADGLNQLITRHGLAGHVEILGRPCCLVFATRDADQKPSQPFRTLMMQEIMRRGILASSLVIGYSHSGRDIEQTVEAFDGAMAVYRKALDEGVEKHLVGRPVKPSVRPYA
jgi:glutamate-1-semialdehyde 2,1-aminomutase